MTIKLDYKLSPDWTAYEVDLRSADEATLRYDAFPGDIVFRVGDTDLSAQWGWVPVLDFALALENVAEGLLTRTHELFEFTESGATIDFRRNGADTVEITCSYVQGSAAVELAALADAARDFTDRLCDELAARHPGLAGNPAFNEL